MTETLPETLAYAVFMGHRVIRVRHYDLDKPWRSRSGITFPSEHRLKTILHFLEDVSGLQRIHQRHSSVYGYVDLRLSRKVFTQAACALVATYDRNPQEEAMLLAYPDPSRVDAYDVRPRSCRRRW